jgi:hypothetical protein
MLQSYDVDLKLQYFTLLLCFAPNRTADTSINHRLFTLATLVAVTFIYADAMATKLSSSIWLNGSAVWYSMTLPYATLDNLAGEIFPRWMFKVATFAIMLYETFFLLAILHPFRRLISQAGIVLHLLIAALLPLQFFGLLMCGPLLFLCFSPQCSTASPLSRTGKLQLTAICCYLFTLCFTYIWAQLSAVYLPLATFMGISPTGVYSTEILSLENPIVRLELHDGEEVRHLPSFSEDGHPNFSNRLWKNFGFYSRMSPCPRRYFERHIRRLVRCNSYPCSVHVLTKEVQMPLNGSQTYAELLGGHEWINAGQIVISAADSLEMRQNIELPDSTEIFPFYCQPGRNIGEEVTIF